MLRAFLYQTTTPETILDGLCYTINCKDGTCVISEAIEEAPTFHATISYRDQEYSVTAILDVFFCFCIFRSIPVPSFIREIRGTPNRELSRNSPIESGLESLVIDLPVEIINDRAFSCISDIKQVSFGLESVVREIHGFRRMSGLTKIEIPASAEIISGFRDCSSLRDVVFLAPSRLKRISGFWNCDRLEKIDIPDSVEEIWAFSHCRSLKSIVFGPRSQLRRIDGICFCASLEEISFPASVEVVREFFECPLL